MVPDFSSSSLQGLFSLRGRMAAITGGAQGIGAAICTRLAELGADVVIGDLDLIRAEALAEDLARRFSVASQAVALDVRQSSSMESFADAAMRVGGKLDIWVNNAGIFPHSTIAETSEQQWDDVMEINLRGTFLGIKLAAERMGRSPPGIGYSRSIINIASASSLHGRAGRSHYVASKHGVYGLTKSAAQEYGDQGIRVLAIGPTMVSTPGVRAFAAGSAVASSVVEERLLPRLPLGRICVPDDVARVVAFCATDLSAMMTGSMLLVDAGYMSG